MKNKRQSNKIIFAMDVENTCPQVLNCVMRLIRAGVFATVKYCEYTGILIPLTGSSVQESIIVKIVKARTSLLFQHAFCIIGTSNHTQCATLQRSFFRHSILNLVSNILN